MMCDNSTRYPIRAFHIHDGWSFNSTPQRTRVPGFCFRTATRRAVLGRTFAGPGGPAKAVLSVEPCTSRESPRLPAENHAFPKTLTDGSRMSRILTPMLCLRRTWHSLLGSEEHAV